MDPGRPSFHGRALVPSHPVSPCDAPDAVFQHPQLSGERWSLGRQRTGRHARICEYVSTRGRRIFVKQVPPSDGGRPDPRLLREFRALRVLQRKLGPELGQSVPAPVAILGADHLLVTGAVPGVPLAGVLKRDANRVMGLVRFRVLRRCGFAVGQWLGRFRALTRRPDIPHDHDRFCRDLDFNLQRLGPGPLPRGLLVEADRIREASRRLAGYPLPAAGRHSDFLPQNIIVGPGLIGAVDFENYRSRDVALMDPGSLLAYLALLEQRPAYLPRALRAFTAGFVAGLGHPAAGPVQNLFTAGAAIRIARDSGNPGVSGDLLPTLARLCL
jgi:hypothetical protein